MTTTGSENGSGRLRTEREAIREDDRGARPRIDRVQTSSERFLTVAADIAVVTGTYVGLVDEKGFDIALDHAFDPIDGRRRQCTIDTDISGKRRVFDS